MRVVSDVLLLWLEDKWCETHVRDLCELEIMVVYCRQVYYRLYINFYVVISFCSVGVNGPDHDVHYSTFSYILFLPTLIHLHVYSSLSSHFKCSQAAMKYLIAVSHPNFWHGPSAFSRAHLFLPYFSSSFGPVRFYSQIIQKSSTL